MNTLLALAPISAWSFEEWAVAIVIIIAVVALVCAYCQYAGIMISPFVVKCFWIVLGAVIVIVAIRFLLSL